MKESDGSCVACDENCLRCEGSPKKCTDCPPFEALNSLKECEYRLGSLFGFLLLMILILVVFVGVLLIVAYFCGRRRENRVDADDFYEKIDEYNPKLKALARKNQKIKQKDSILDRRDPKTVHKENKQMKYRGTLGRSKMAETRERKKTQLRPSYDGRLGSDKKDLSQVSEKGMMDASFDEASSMIAQEDIFESMANLQHVPKLDTSFQAPLEESKVIYGTDFRNEGEN